MDKLNLNFKEYYFTDNPLLVDDKEILKALKRQVTSYLRETSQERLHGIFNKIFILNKSIPNNKFYDIIINEMNSPEKKKFMTFLLTEGFNQTKFCTEERIVVDNVWECQLKRILSNYKKSSV